MTIRILSEQLASQIAAGEVVERPMSVVKELIENALDAGAKTINIDCRAGGQELIQVADDGCGIAREEVQIAFLRHATSKLGSADDLFAIPSLGFRGEALAAISSVSQIIVVTRTASATSGTRLELHGGQLVHQDEVGAPVGTVMAVQSLFFNTPARQKFLKSVSAERQAIDELITRYALAYPQIRWRLVQDGRIVFQTGGTGKVRDVLVAVYGVDVAQQLLEVESSAEPLPSAEVADETAEEATMPRAPIHVTGFISPPSLHRSNRGQMTLFVNGRWIKDQQLTFAIVEAYHTFLPTGRYPIALIFIELSYDQVDVNVHPTKAEVRFQRPRAVFTAVQKGVRATLLAQPLVRSLNGQEPPRPFEQITERHHWPDRPTIAWEAQQPELTLPPENEEKGEMSEPATSPQIGRRLPILRVMGQIHNAYLIAEGPEGLYLVDQHAAHERILYEQMLAQWQQKKIAVQSLIAGMSIQLTPAQTSLLQTQLPLLSQFGFEIEPFGPQLFVIRAVPALLHKSDPIKSVRDLIETLEQDKSPLQSKMEALVLRRVCKAFAIKAGQQLSAPEMEGLIRQLEQCEVPMSCPHGRPTMIHLSVGQLAQQFGR